MTHLVHHHRTTPRSADADVVVVGARCAGAATALLLARAGHDVLLLDRDAFPSDTLSTHVLARSGLVQLDRWGLLPDVLAGGAPRIRTAALYTPDRVSIRQIPDRWGIDFLLAPRRVALDDVLQRAAVAAGARLRTGVTVDDVLRDERGRVTGVLARDVHGPLEVHARRVVGADGRASRVARAVGAPRTDVRPATGATQYAYYDGHWPSLEHHVGVDGFAGVFPTHGGQACIWVCSPEDRARHYRHVHGGADQAFEALLRDTAPALVERTPTTARTTPVRGMLRMPNHTLRPYGPGWALVGDAGLHRDAITGHGMSDAFRDAELLADALDVTLRSPAQAAEALADYERTRDRMAGPIRDITSAMGAFPEQDRFLELRSALTRAIEVQAEELAVRPHLTPAAA